MTQHTPAMAAATLMVACLSAAPADAQQGATGGEWRWRTADTHLVYEGEQGASLAPAGTIFDLLEAAEPNRWVTRPSIRRLMATPLMVDGVLYLSAPINRSAAIDARTGETLWVHDPRIYEAGTPAPAPWAHRAVAYWENRGEARIVWGTGEGHLVTLDARTGLPSSEFRNNGRVNLTENLTRAAGGQHDNLNLLPVSSQSAPLVVGDTIIIGSSMHDFNITKEMPPGFASTYDARTGRHKWYFHNEPQSADPFGVDTWLNESWRYSGNANLRSNLSADAELSYVYLPTSTPTFDDLGGHRPG